MVTEIFKNERGQIFVEKDGQYLHFRKKTSNMSFTYDLKNQEFWKIKTYKSKEDEKVKVDIGNYTGWFYLCSFVINDDKFAKMILFTLHSHDFYHNYSSNIRLVQRLSSPNTQRFEQWYGYGYKIKEVEDFFKDIQDDGTCKKAEQNWTYKYHNIHFRYEPNEASKETHKILKNIQKEHGNLNLMDIEDMINYYNNGEYEILQSLVMANEKVENRGIFTERRYNGENNIFEQYRYPSTRPVRMLIDIIKDFHLDLNAFLNWLRMQKNVEKNGLNFIIDHYYDYLKMQLAIHGNKYSKINKYPKNFRTVEHQTVVEYNAIKKEIDAKKFRSASYEFKDLEYGDPFYQIIVPTSPEMIDEEASCQHNCLRSYKDTMMNGKTCICFMRNAMKLDESLVSIEVRDNTVVQAYGEHNRYVTSQERNFIDKWAKVRGLELSYAYKDI